MVWSASSTSPGTAESTHSFWIRSWRADAAPPSLSATGTAEQLLLFAWGRLTMSDLKVEGDRPVFERLIALEPEE
ncbi:hypothetical protein [Streptomyces collinus]|uniref:hypothetical protein n=1 Tax=Streptomyces collinus TaxID=42684 RepID=UPI00362F7C8C